MAGVVRSFGCSLFKHGVRISVCSQNVLLEPHCTKNKYFIRYVKTESVDDLIKEASVDLVEDHDEEVMAKKEEEIQRKRNKSRLADGHRNILFGEMPYKEPMAWFHDTVKYKRKMYGRYGEASGVFPGVMWPTKEDLEETREYEKVAYPDSIQDMILKEEKKKIEEQALLKAREEDLLKKYSKLNQWKNDVMANVAKKLAAAEAAKAKKERLVEEVRRFFGYKMDPRDDRFKEMLEKKEKEERKLAKEAKKKAKYQVALARLQADIQIKVQGTETIPVEVQTQPETETKEQQKT